MKSFVGQQPVRAVIFDWAGTTVDYGCYAPFFAFRETFSGFGIEAEADEIRAPMGLLKRDHIRAMLKMERIRSLWLKRKGREATESDIEELFEVFERTLDSALVEYSEPVPGILGLVDWLKSAGIKIGSTTGYTTEMIRVVAAAAAARGYAPDCVVAADEVLSGRPAPYMCYQNALRLGVYPLSSCVKVGDTVSDIEEGLNAGMWSVGVVCGGSELGLSLAEVSAMDSLELEARKEKVRRIFLDAGAHYVADSIADIAGIVAEIGSRVGRGSVPQVRGAEEK